MTKQRRFKPFNKEFVISKMGKRLVLGMIFVAPLISCNSNNIKQKTA